MMLRRNIAFCFRANIVSVSVAAPVPGLAAL
jgi:hypothetical protein